MSCSICLETIKNEGIINCGHSFCKTCIHRWSRRNNACPLCRETFYEIRTEQMNIVVSVPTLRDNTGDEERRAFEEAFFPMLNAFLENDVVRRGLADDYRSPNPHYLTVSWCNTIWSALHKLQVLRDLLDSGVTRESIINARNILRPLIEAGPGNID